MKLILIALTCASLLTVPARAATIVGPTPYLSRADTPAGIFDPSDPRYSLCFQDFEDPAGPWEVGFSLDVGERIGPKTVSGGGFPVTDSVDADDGAIDGDGTMGSSWYARSARQLTITFDAATAAAGFVFTDADPLATQLTIQGFDVNNAVIASTIIGGADRFWDDVFNGTTPEDRFFGFVAPEGLKKITMTIDQGMGIEIDHVQFTKAVPEASSLALAVVGLGGLFGWTRRRRGR